MLAVSSVFWAADATLADTFAQSGQVTSVTAYQGEAMVTRQLSILAPPGEHDIVVARLPSALRVDGINASVTTGNARVLDVFVQESETLANQHRDKLVALDRKLADLVEKQASLKMEEDALQAKAGYLKRLEQFSAESLGTDLRRGALDTESLKQLVVFNFTQRDELAKKATLLASARRAMEKEGEDIRKKRDMLEQEGAAPELEAVIRLQKLSGGTSELELSYWVERVSWRSRFSVSADTLRSEVTLAHSIEIMQRSGEDWSKARLVVSSAERSRELSPPRLSALKVTLKRGESIENTREIANINTAFVEVHEDELGREPTSINAVYEIDGLTSVADREQYQSLLLARDTVPAKIYSVAVPLLRPTVHREVSFLNESDYLWLPGVVDVFADGGFVGTTQMDMTPTGEIVTLGLGINATLQTSRRLTSREQVIRGGVRAVTLTYRVAIQNSGEVNVPVQLFERLPVAANPDTQVSVRLLDGGQGLSDDTEYQENTLKKGILRWDVEVPPGPESFALEYSYVVEADRNFQLAHDAPRAPSTAGNTTNKSEWSFHTN